MIMSSLSFTHVTFRPWQRAFTALSYLVGFGLVAMVLHEFFHFVALYSLGGEGYITFSMAVGLTHFTQFPDHAWVVAISGGLLTGVFLLVIFWFGAWSNRPNSNTGMEAAAFVWAIGNLVYAPMEVVTSSPAAAAAAFGVGFTLAAAWYFVRLMDWIALPELDDPITTAVAQS